MSYVPQHPVEVLALIVALVIGVLILATSSGGPGGRERRDDPVPGSDYLPSVLSQPGPRGDAGWVLAALVAVLLLGAAAAWLAVNKYI